MYTLSEDSYLFWLALLLSGYKVILYYFIYNYILQ